MPKPPKPTTETKSRSQATQERSRRALVADSDFVSGSCHPRLANILIAKSQGSEGSTGANQNPDPFSGFYNAGIDKDLSTETPTVLEPSIALEDLLDLPGMSATLPPCIDAMVVNCDLTGWSLIYNGKEGRQGGSKAQKERQRIEALLQCPNPDEPFILTREKVRKEYETLGFGTLEVVRDAKGEITSFYHIPAHTLRLTTKDKRETLVNSYRWIGDESKKYSFRKRFRRWVQRVSSSQLTYFKEFGDPRPISSVTGQVAPKGTPANELATEILWFPQYTPGQVYPLPRHISQLPSILGSREAEHTNYHFFKDNAIPAMVVLVSGGYLTDETAKNLQDKFRSNRGRRSMNKVLIIEAQVDDDTRDLADTTPENPKLEFKALSQDRQQDALFLDYLKMNAHNIRSSYRIPPIFIGLTEDYSRATATASLELGESQVFGPERSKFDAIINVTILLHEEKPPRYWTFRSNASKAVGSSVTEALVRLEKIGAVTPNIGIKLAKQIFNIDIEEIELPWGDMPFDFTKTLLMNGNMDLSGNFLDKSLKFQSKVPVKGGAAK